MTLTSLQALSWSTVTGAVVSALLLASGETGAPELSLLRRDAAPRAPSAAPPAGTLRALPVSHDAVDRQRVKAQQVVSR